LPEPVDYGTHPVFTFIGVCVDAKARFHVEEIGYQIVDIAGVRFRHAVIDRGAL
jgi:hypothetical protein